MGGIPKYILLYSVNSPTGGPWESVLASVTQRRGRGRLQEEGPREGTPLISAPLVSPPLSCHCRLAWVWVQSSVCGDRRGMKRPSFSYLLLAICKWQHVTCKPNESSLVWSCLLVFPTFCRQVVPFIVIDSLTWYAKYSCLVNFVQTVCIVSL